MLDTDSPAADDTTTPAQPRRRRAASRPAGPPVDRTRQPAATDQALEPSLESAALDAAGPAEVVHEDTAAEPAEAVHDEPEADEDAAAEPAEEPQVSGPDDSATEEPLVDDPAIEAESAADDAATGADSPPAASSPEPEPAGEAEAEPVDLVPEATEEADQNRSVITEVTVEAAAAEPEQQPLSLGDLHTLDELAPRTSVPADAAGAGRPSPRVRRPRRRPPRPTRWPKASTR